MRRATGIGTDRFNRVSAQIHLAGEDDEFLIQT